MKAMVLRRFGGPDVFEVADLPIPQVLPGQVLIRVVASSLNPLETKIRSGLVPAITPPFPAILGSDVCGEVVAVGQKDGPFAVGDWVYGMAGGIGQIQGALAEYMVADTRLLARKPTNLTPEQAALYPLVSITAWEAICEQPLVRPGDHLLIHGATGGVGQIAIQLAKQLGAQVTGTVTSAAKADIARSLGADHVSISSAETLDQANDRLTQGQGFDAVFDSVGGAHLADSLQVVRRYGTVCTINARTQLDLGLMHSKALTLRAVFAAIPILYDQDRQRQGQILSQVSELIEADQLRIHADPEVFAFSEISKAHARYEARQATGKISLVNRF